MAIVNSQYVERYLLPSVLFVLALSLRLHGLGQRSMWNDEMFTLQLVRHPWKVVKVKVIVNEIMFPNSYIIADHRTD